MTCVNIRTQVGARRAAHELALRGLVQEIQFGLENFGQEGSDADKQIFRVRCNDCDVTKDDHAGVCTCVYRPFVNAAAAISSALMMCGW